MAAKKKSASENTVAPYLVGASELNKINGVAYEGTRLMQPTVVFGMDEDDAKRKAAKMVGCDVDKVYIFGKGE